VQPTLTPQEAMGSEGELRSRLRRLLREGALDEREIELTVQATPVNVQIMTPPGMEDMSNQLESLFRGMSPQRTRKRRLKLREARKLVLDEEAAKLINEDELKLAAVSAAEQQGIVFIDEIDKITRRGETMGADVSREGVQRDLLPLVEGCTVSTKYGMVRTDHVLFIASGAFHVSKPSDLIPELQGRFPIRVELNALTADDFVRILPSPTAVCANITPRSRARRIRAAFRRGRCAASRTSPTRSISAPKHRRRPPRCSNGCWRSSHGGRSRQSDRDDRRTLRGRALDELARDEIFPLHTVTH
jgi:ATP-dependent protease HslVU ATPase subunit